MQGIELDNRTISIIKAQIEQQFKRTYGKPYDWKNILKSGSIKRVIDDLRLTLNIPGDITKFRNIVQDMLRNNEKYQFFMQTEKDPVCYKIKRTNKFQGVSDYRSLVHLVDKYPGGLFVDEELTHFTFREAKKEIQRAIDQKRIKRIYKEGTKEQYFYIFPRKYQTEYQIRQETFKQFGMSQYLQLCYQFNTSEESTDKVKESKEKVSKESNADPNYKLPGYIDLKQKWLKKNTKK